MVGVENRREVETLLALHRVMRQDANRLMRRVAVVSSRLDARSARELERWFDIYRRALDQHHEIEDEVLFPMLAERDRSFAAATAELSAQHGEIQTALTEFGDALSATGVNGEGGVGACRAAAEALADVLEEHTLLEEQHVTPVANSLTDADFRTVDKAAERRYPLRESLMTIPWMIESFDDAERANLFAWQPRAVRVVYGLTRSAYRRRARAAGMLP